jgi:prepilin-type N-terminal cleavage/methylation domain-containing protein
MKAVQKGFTLIELLIFIAVLGILAIAVLAAINPLEQINRSRDTANRSDAEQLIGAIDRYNASRGYMPWQEDSSVAIDIPFTQVDDTWVGSDATVVLDNLTDETGELKESFQTKIVAGDYNELFVYNSDASGASTYICFLPRSDSFLDEAENRCGDPAGGSLPSDLDIGATICGGFGEEGALRVVYSCLP